MNFVCLYSLLHSSIALPPGLVGRCLTQLETLPRDESHGVTTSSRTPSRGAAAASCAATPTSTGLRCGPRRRRPRRRVHRRARLLPESSCSPRGFPRPGPRSCTRRTPNGRELSLLRTRRLDCMLPRPPANLGNQFLPVAACAIAASSYYMAPIFEHHIDPLEELHELKSIPQRQTGTVGVGLHSLLQMGFGRRSNRACDATIADQSDRRPRAPPGSALSPEREVSSTELGLLAEQRRARKTSDHERVRARYAPSAAGPSVPRHRRTRNSGSAVPRRRRRRLDLRAASCHSLYDVIVTRSLRAFTAARHIAS